MYSLNFWNMFCIHFAIKAFFIPFLNKLYIVQLGDLQYVIPLNKVLYNVEQSSKRWDTILKPLYYSF